MRKVTVKQAIKVNRMLERMWRFKWNEEIERFSKKTIKQEPKK